MSLSTPGQHKQHLSPHSYHIPEFTAGSCLPSSSRGSHSTKIRSPSANRADFALCCTESIGREAEHGQAHQQADLCTWEGSVPGIYFPEANTTPLYVWGPSPCSQSSLLSSSWFSCVSNTASTALLCFQWVNKSSILFKIKSKFKFWLKYCSLLMLQPGSYSQSELMPTPL